MSELYVIDGHLWERGATFCGLMTSGLYPGPFAERYGPDSRIACPVCVANYALGTAVLVLVGVRRATDARVRRALADVLRLFRQTEREEGRDDG